MIDYSTGLKLGRSRSGKGARSCSYSGQDSGEAHLEDADVMQTKLESLYSECLEDLKAVVSIL